MTIIRNILAFIVGAFVGGAVNMGIIVIGAMLISSPAGIDSSNAESIAANIHLFEPKHFVSPFLAHAVGTLCGAIVAYLIAGSYKLVLVYLIGGLFLAGGIVACFIIPAPTWFMALDLIGAYIPMAWLATLIGRNLTDRS